MKLVRRDSSKGYLDTLMWIPKNHVNVEGVKNALEFTFFENRQPEILQLWKETPDHIGVPREFFSVEELGIEMVDCRPSSYPRVDIQDRIVLDLMNPGKTTQQDALAALLAARGGILELACVAGDTELQLSRGGKGFRMDIATLWDRWHYGPRARYTWDRTIPTFVRAEVGGRIGLQRVRDVLSRGERLTYEVRLLNGKTLRLTRDHQVLTPTGFRSIDEGLSEGDEVITDGARTATIRKKKVAYRRIGGFNFHPCARYQSRSWLIEEHRAVAEATLNGLSLDEFRERCRRGDIHGLQFINPQKYHVHHKDGDTTNNNAANLEALPGPEHLEHHRPGASAFGNGVPTPVKIAGISEGQVEQVYDIVCDDPHHNFVANGVVVHNCGKGKTVVFLKLLAKLHVPALIAVDNLSLLYQWRREILKHLEIGEDEIGLIAEGSFDWKKPVVLATYTSLADRADTFPEEARRWFGVFCGDEGHHLKAKTWCRAVDLFPCRRYALTATPKTSDGRHVIFDFHVGKVLFRDKTQDLRPDVGFLWTGLELDMSDVKTRELVCDRNGELHVSKLASYFGQWPERLEFILGELKKLHATKRRILVLSNSVAETVNLLALWNGITDLYSDIPTPTPADVGETVPAEMLEDRQIGQLKRGLGNLIGQLKEPTLPEVKRKNLEKTRKEIVYRLQKHTCWKKVELELGRRQRAYIKKVVEDTKNGEAGLMIHKVKPDVRAQMLAEKTIVFAITKYGREGLDEPRLDTLFVCEPGTDRNGLEQMMGRVQRAFQNKQHALVLFVEDKIGLMIGMCNKLREHLRNWPLDQGGPYEYDLLGHPTHKFKTPTIRF